MIHPGIYCDFDNNEKPTRNGGPVSLLLTRDYTHLGCATKFRLRVYASRICCVFSFPTWMMEFYKTTNQMQDDTSQFWLQENSLCNLFARKQIVSGNTENTARQPDFSDSSAV